MEDNLIDNIVIFENALFVGELCDVVRRLWVVRCQFLVDDFVLLFLSEVLLVSLLVSLHVKQLIVVL